MSTNSICQGQQASDLWPVYQDNKVQITFAHQPFKWQNLAAHNAGVTVIVIGLSANTKGVKKVYYDDFEKVAEFIGPYLIPNSRVVVSKQSNPISDLPSMLFGNMPRDGGNLFLTSDEKRRFIAEDCRAEKYIKKFLGSDELINGLSRNCIWVEQQDYEEACEIGSISQRFEKVSENRRASAADSTRSFANKPYRFVQIAGRANRHSIVIPRVSSENRDYLPVDLCAADTIIGDRNFAIYDSDIMPFAIIASRMHWVWISTVCVRLEMRFSYSNTLGWNTFPLPLLSEQNKIDLTKCAENILIARQEHFPNTIADLYNPEAMPENLRRAHEMNDEVLERIYIGRRFRNDTERLEKLFELYTKMTSNEGKSVGSKKPMGRSRNRVKAGVA